MSNRSLSKIQLLSNDAGLILANRRSARGAISDLKRGSFYFCAHKGCSMNPTLNETDVLEIEPYGSRPIRVGDVIFFLSPDGGRPAVHRVAGVIAEGVQTKGDNNNGIDPWVIHPGDVIGRVIRAARGEKKRAIYGGTVGRLWSFGVSGFRVAVRGLSFFYHVLAQSGLFRRLVPLHKRMRVVSLHQKDGRSFKLLLGHWMIGNYKSGTNYWQIRRPFRLFVDVESLPK